MKKLLKIVYYSLFSINTPSKLALASNIGLFVGLTSVIDINWKFSVLIFLSILYQLNILALSVGLLLTLVFLTLKILIFFFSQWALQQHLLLSPLWSYLHSVLYNWAEINTIPGLQIKIPEVLFILAMYPLSLYFYKRTLISERRFIKKPFIFYDQSGRRWDILKKTTIIFLIVSIAVSIVFSISMVSNPYIKEVYFANMDLTQPSQSSVYDKSDKKLQQQLLDKENVFHSNIQTNKKFSSLTQPIYGFYTSWDQNSFISLKSNAHLLNTVIPDWYRLDAQLNIHEKINIEVDGFIKKSNLQQIPLISNYIHGKWDSNVLHRLLSSSGNRKKFIESLCSKIKNKQYAGINIDFENISPKDKDHFTAFSRELYQKFHSESLLVTFDVSPNDSAVDYTALSKYSDTIFVMFYDQHSQINTPGPIASMNWFKKSLQNLHLPVDKVVPAFGSYGYDWVTNTKETAVPLSYRDVMSIAVDKKVNIHWDKNTLNPYINYKEGVNFHKVWFLDAVTLYNQFKTTQQYGLKGMALWRLGAEDPSIWEIIKNKTQLDASLETLDHIANPDFVHYKGEGEILRVISYGQDGERSFQINAQGLLYNQVYNQYPTQYVVQRIGKKDKKIVLTFDDGPDPKYTIPILDILAKYHIKASFFIVGENAQIHPDIVKRIYQEGHEIGNHTFTHPNIADTSPFITKLELNSTQRLIQQITGHSTVLFRPPYVADAEPYDANEILPVIRAQKLGYTMIGELIDPNDWDGASSDRIYKEVMDKVKNGNIILLHDSGGDRSNTVAVLPKLIKSLQKQGYTFTTISGLVDKTREDLMPKVKIYDRPFLAFNKAIFITLANFRNGLISLTIIGFLIGMSRSILLIIFSKKQLIKNKKIQFDETYQPAVSVVIAAYNEEKVIIKTINSILQNDYPKFEVIIVDDGSSDKTVEVIKKHYENNEKIKLFQKENGGKSSAINVGFKNASGEIVVALDADTIISSNAISLLVRYFIDDHIAAVSGNVKVGNVHNLLTLFQHIEYVTGFNLERRAFTELNCITVVPGAIGAWRKSAVQKSGYFKEDTLAEDTDLTLNLLKQGYTISFEEKAYAYTEAPDDLKSLIKQRFRWSYGTLQCLFKHRSALFNKQHKTLGFIAIPNMWLFQYVFQAAAPFLELYFIIGLFGHTSMKSALYYFIFLLIDSFLAIYAFRLEKLSIKPLLWLFFQRIIFRQIMSYVVIKSIIAALKGLTVGWNKLQRQGNVEEKLP